jgi:hypothetical protein
MDAEKKQLLKKLALAAAVRPVNLVVLAVGLVASMALGVGGGSAVGIAVLALALVAYAGLVAMDLMNRRFVEDTVHGKKRGARLRIELSEDEGFIPPERIGAQDLRGVYEMIVNKFERAKSAFEVGGNDLQLSLRESIERCLELVKEAGKTATKGDKLRIYLDSESAAQMEKDARRLESQAKNATDGAARDNYKQAAEAKRQQLATYRQIEGLYDRVNAQLSVIETSLETVNAKLVKLSATDVQEAIAANQSIATHLESVHSDIHTLETTVEETIQEFTL